MWEDAATLALVEQLKSALEQYKEKYGFYPPTLGMNSSGYVEFYLDAYSPSATDASHPERMNKNNFNQFLPFDNLVNGGLCEETESGGVFRYKVLDYFQNPIYYRCPGYINRNSYDIGSLGSDGKVGDGTTNKSGSDIVKTEASAKTAAADFGKGDDITNCKR